MTRNPIPPQIFASYFFHFACTASAAATRPARPVSPRCPLRSHHHLVLAALPKRPTRRHLGIKRPPFCRPSLTPASPAPTPTAAMRRRQHVPLALPLVADTASLRRPLS
ncbi:hypothetical protein C8F04DRAFT_1263829 [Mycena alexandri]|uniref:Uncharacterized protein n=1 Tax=Mycena alexandri TaxID=1745969 RepID=A0AAD6SME2_9AGAR|nr:hypothetical protein C8F04DRAFT_1263829 [Mycena alexandri]